MMSPQIGITVCIQIMTDIFTAQVLHIGNNESATVLSGVTSAIWVNAALCLLMALAAALSLQKSAMSLTWGAEDSRELEPQRAAGYFIFSRVRMRFSLAGITGY